MRTKYIVVGCFTILYIFSHFDTNIFQPFDMWFRDRDLLYVFIRFTFWKICFLTFIYAQKVFRHKLLQKEIHCSYLYIIDIVAYEFTFECTSSCLKLCACFLHVLSCRIYIYIRNKSCYYMLSGVYRDLSVEKNRYCSLFRFSGQLFNLLNV